MEQTIVAPADASRNDGQALAYFDRAYALPKRKTARARQAVSLIA
jgi:hypothetical protein